jgi:hypothetical protein
VGPINAAWLIVAALCSYAIAYRFREFGRPRMDLDDHPAVRCC